MANKHPNTDNLKPLNTRTQDERREIAKKGAEASNKKQAEKKLLRDSLLELLALTDEVTGLTNQERLIKALYEKATTGDVQAFNSLRDTIGQKPVEKSENLNTEVSYSEWLESLKAKNGG